MNLPAVATDVGQCAEVLDGGAAGILVQPKDSEAIARAVTYLLSHPVEAQALAERLHLRVSEAYGVRAGINSICSLYKELVDRNP